MTRASRDERLSRWEQGQAVRVAPDVERPPDVPPPDPGAIVDVANVRIPHGPLLPE